MSDMERWLEQTLAQGIKDLSSPLAQEMTNQVKGTLTKTVGHEPTNGNWEDYLQFLGEINSIEVCLQRAKDRENIRRLVFGKDRGNTKTG